MSTTSVISNICRIAEEFAQGRGLTGLEIARVVHARDEGKDEWIIQLEPTETDPLLEDDGQCAIIVVDSETEKPRLIEGL
ncbi:MAG: hypothetical protein WD065_20890 [Planctomycetaceae bacterium]